MKLTMVLLILFCFSAKANLNAQFITINVKETPVKNVIRQIQAQSGYNIIYNSSLLQKIPPVTLNISNASVKEALLAVFKNQPVAFEITGKTIVLKPRTMVQGISEISAFESVNIHGRVTDSLGNPLAGVSVQVKGKLTGTVTDANGMFSLSADVGDVLVITSVGFTWQEVRVKNNVTNIEITLRREPQEIESIVITALGVKRAERALTYNVQQLDGEELTRNKDANFVNALTGKVAGVTINASAAGIGGATRVVMRGTKSITGNNNALYVVDGIPIPNRSGGNASGPFAGVVSGEGISSFNPEDIESVSVLTGPSATALYGNQGANGVVVITTKKASKGKIKVAVSHSSDFFSPFVLPEFQNTYGQTDPLQMFSWGPKLDKPSAYKPKDFFQRGTNIFNSVSISGGTEKSQTLFSVGANNANGIIPNNTFNRYNFYLRQTSKLTNRLSADFSAMYVKLDDRNMIAQGQYHNPLVPVYLFPPGDDIAKYKVYKRYDPNRKLYDQFWPYGSNGLEMENPYWIAFEEANTNNTDRFMLSTAVTYEAFKWLDIVGRARIDNSYVWGQIKRPAGTSGLFASEYGFYSTSKLAAKSTYLDLMAAVKQDITRDLKFRSNLGGSYQDDKLDGLGAGGNLTKLANFYSVQENTANFPTQRYGHTQLQSVFATAEFDYKKWLFLNATGRYEWPSQLPKEQAAQSSYFYPSVGLSAVITKMLGIPQNVLSFAKVRASYAEVGSPPAQGITIPTYSLNNINRAPRPFYDYRPERTKSYEVGFDLKFFDNKLSLNVTGYKSNTYNQLLTRDFAEGALYTFTYYNAGNVANKGIEASLGYNNKFGDFEWSSNVVFSLNRNKIIRLSEGTIDPLSGKAFGKDSVKVGTAGSDLFNILTSGGSMADLYVTQALRYDNQGNLWANPVGGGLEKINISPKYIGRTTPDYNIGWRNGFSWKNIDLSFLIDARVGGSGVSFTQANLDAFGVSKKSADEREQGGVAIYGNLYPDVENFYKTAGLSTGGQTGLAFLYVYSLTNIRLREMSVGYTLPRLGNKIIDNIRVSVTGRNLFMFYNKAPFDPESTASTGTFYQGVDYFMQPSYRSFGFSIRAQF